MPTRNSRLESHSQFVDNFNQSIYFQDVKDSSIDENVIIANRPKLYAKLVNVVAFDLDITAFELNESNDLIAIVAGRVVYLVRLSSWTVMDKLGRVDGGAHKANIRDISINSTCKYIASAGEDKRIAVWSIKKQVSEITFEAHSGAIFQIEFAGTEENLITCSEDGLVLIWDWRTGTAISSFMRHPSAVRAFDFTYDYPNQVYCARNDGYISVWNTDYLMRMDNIEPDPQWQANAEEESLLGYNNVEKGHSGAILCLKIAPNGWLLASGSSDHTCKIWCTISYRKPLSQVQEDIFKAEQSLKDLNAYIDITNPLYDLQTSDRSVLKIGEVHLPTAYQASLLLTLRHDGPVISSCFSPDSTILATGSTDATCRLWSTIKGDLLFQIDTPSVINRIYFSDNTSFYCSCMNRLIYFDYNIKARENTQKDMLPTPELIYANRKEEIPLPVSRGGVTPGRQRKKQLIITESVEDDMPPATRRKMSSLRTLEEEDAGYLDEHDADLVLSEQELEALPEEERRRYSMRSSIRESIQEPKPISQRNSISYSLGGSIPGTNRPSIRKSVRRRHGLDQVAEDNEEYEEDVENDAIISRKESIVKSRKQSLDTYASLRASRDKFLSEEYIRGIPEDSEPEVLPLNTAKRVSLFELKNLAAGNLLNYSAFKSIAEHSEGVDVNQLEKNMEKYGIRPHQVLRVMTSNPFKPDHILQALSKPGGGEVPVLCAMISRNNPIAGYMNKMGYRADGTLSDADQRRRTIVLEKKDVQSPSRRASVISSKTNTFNYGEWYKASFGAPLVDDAKREDSDENWSSEESEGGLNLNSNLTVKGVKSAKDKILHFIPSAQRRILKDFALQKMINPIFLRQLMAESETGSIYPNFSVDTLSETQPSAITINKVERFNENTGIPRGRIQSFNASTSLDMSIFNPRNKRRSTEAGRPLLGNTKLPMFKPSAQKLDTNFDFSSFITKLSSNSFSNKSKSEELMKRATRSRHDSIPNTQSTNALREFKRLTSRLPVSPTRLEGWRRMGSESLTHLGSRTILQPDRYFKTRGLSVRFDNHSAPTSSFMGKQSVYVTPTELRTAKNDVHLMDIYVEKQQSYGETKID